MINRQPGMASLRRTRAWHRGLDLVVEIYRVTGRFPRDERFGLVAQLRRAALSVPSNIAEGIERDTQTERRRFLTVARSSIAEVETQLEAARRLGFIDDTSVHGVLEITDHVSAMLTRMHRRIGDRAAL
jgi:four helix bundle protein